MIFQVDKIENQVASISCSEDSTFSISDSTSGWEIRTAFNPPITASRTFIIKLRGDSSSAWISTLYWNWYIVNSGSFSLLSLNKVTTQTTRWAANNYSNRFQFTCEGMESTNGLNATFAGNFERGDSRKLLINFEFRADLI